MVRLARRLGTVFVLLIWAGCLLPAKCLPEDEIGIDSSWERPVMVGSPVSTGGWEDSPFISPDGLTLYFTYFRVDPITAMQQKRMIVTGPERPGWPTKQVGIGGAEIYWTTKQAGRWRIPVNIGTAINSPFDFEGDECVSADGNEIIFTAGDDAGSMYCSRRINGVWSPRVLATSLGYPFQPHDENPHLTLDGKTLFFQSAVRPGFGGKDLWMSEKIGNRWSTARNLGNPINTSGDEGSPCSLDGKVLYFESPAGIIFSQKMPDGTWTRPRCIVKFTGKDGAVGDPVVARNGDLYFIFGRKIGDSWNADIMYARRK